MLAEFTSGTRTVGLVHDEANKLRLSINAETQTVVWWYIFEGQSEAHPLDSNGKHHIVGLGTSYYVLDGWFPGRNVTGVM